MHSDELSPVIEPRKRRRRRSGSAPRARHPYATSLYKFAKYALLISGITAGVYLALKTSMDFVTNPGGDNITRSQSPSTSAVSGSDNTEGTNTTQALTPPELIKARTIDDSIAYEVTAYTAKLWHALDDETKPDLLLQRGSEVEAIDISGEWLHVRTESGLTGFVHESMLSKRGR